MKKHKLSNPDSVKPMNSSNKSMGSILKGISNFNNNNNNNARTFTRTGMVGSNNSSLLSNSSNEIFNPSDSGKFLVLYKLMMTMVNIFNLWIIIHINIIIIIY